MYNLLWCEDDNENEILFSCNTIKEMRKVVAEQLKAFKQHGFIIKYRISPDKIPARQNTAFIASAKLRNDAYFRFSIEYRRIRQ